MNTTNVKLAIVIAVAAFMLGFLAAELAVSKSTKPITPAEHLAIINAQVAESVKAQQISNRNDACFEYINKSIVEEIKGKKLVDKK